MEALLISTAVLAAFMLLLRFVAPPFKPTFRIEERISTQALLNRISFLSKVCAVTESGYGVSTRSVKKSLKKCIRILRKSVVPNDSVIPQAMPDMLMEVYDRLKNCNRMCLKQGHVGRMPRLFILCDTIVRNTRGCVTQELLQKSVDEFAPLTDDEKSELFDVLLLCLSGIVCTALEDYFKRCRAYNVGYSDAAAERIDLDRLRNTDYICGQHDGAKGDGAIGLYNLAENNGIDVDAAVESGSRHMAETAEILFASARAMEFALSKAPKPRALRHAVSRKTEYILRIAAVVAVVVSVSVGAVFSGVINIAAILLSSCVLYNAYNTLLLIFGIRGGILPAVPDRFIAVVQGFLILFCAFTFSGTVFVFAVSTVFCEWLVRIYSVGETGSIAPLKPIPRTIKNFVAVPSRIFKLKNKVVAVISQIIFSAAIITVNALFSNSPILYVVGAVALSEPIYDKVEECVARFWLWAKNRTKGERISFRRIGKCSVAVGRCGNGKIAVYRHGNLHELNYTVSCGGGALSLSKSAEISRGGKRVFFANSRDIEVAAEVITPPAHDCCAVRLSAVNRTPHSIDYNLSVTCASEAAEEFIGLYVDGASPDLGRKKILAVNKQGKIDAFGKLTAVSVLSFGDLAEYEPNVIGSDGYFDIGNATMPCCRAENEYVDGELRAETGNAELKNILCGEGLVAEVSDSGVTSDAFGRAYVILIDDACPQTAWSPTVYPCGYSNRTLHYNGFSRFIGVYNDVGAVLDIFAVRGKGALLYRLELKNSQCREVDMQVRFICELPYRDGISVTNRQFGVGVGIKGGDGFFVGSTEKIQSDKTVESNKLAIRTQVKLKCREKKTVAFSLSYVFESLDITEVNRRFDEATSYYNYMPIRPMTTDKTLDYVFGRALYRVKCCFSDIRKFDTVTALALCYVYRYIDSDDVLKCITDMCSKPLSVASSECLALPIAVDSYIRYVGNFEILNDDNVKHAVATAMNAAYLHLSSEYSNVGAATIRYCANRFYNLFSPEQRFRFLNITSKSKVNLSNATMLAGAVCGGTPYRAAELYDEENYDDGYAALCELKTEVSKFDCDIIKAALYCSIVIEKLFGIDRRGESIKIMPATSLGTPHIEFFLCEDDCRTHIVVSDNGDGDGSWFAKIGNVVYATNTVTVADYPAPIILFRR